jgi:hypothetical protein
MVKCRKISIKILASAVLMILMISAGTVDAAWETGVIDGTGDVGAYCELVRDGSGDMHAVYIRRDTDELIIISSVGTIWQAPERVDTSGSVGGYCAIALTAAEERKLSYYRSGTRSLFYTGPELSNEWETGPVTSSDDDMGRYCAALYHQDGSISVSCRNAMQESLVLIEGDTSCVWEPVQTIDPGPARGSYCDHAYGTGVGYMFSEFESGHRSLVYVDSIRVPVEWETGPVTSSDDDIGRYCATLYHQDGSISVSCRNATEESLVLIEGDTSCVWEPVQTIDPGPARGSYCDHAYGTGVGYMFSEFESGHRSLVCVDSVLAPSEWEVGIVSDRFESGRHVSSCLAPDGRIASAFYFYNETLMGGVHISGTDDAGRSVVKGVVDSIAGDPSSGVYIDLDVTPEWDWHISYRNTLDGFLYYAFLDSCVITGTENEEGQQPLPVPSDFHLHQNVPNPFNPLTTIRFDLPRAARVRLLIYNVKGELVAILIDRKMTGGRKAVLWDGKNGRGRAVASGVYFYRLVAGDYAQTRKMVLLR